MTARKSEILVVDDEQTQLETICRGLFLYGYQCKGALNISDALKILNRSSEQYRLVLTDLTMPEQSGMVLIEQIKKSWPSMPIIVITGLASTPETEEIRRMNIPVLPKPFRPDQLDEMIREQLVDR